jgi:hypothetical protein
MESSGTLKAVVRNGRLILDEPTELPEGEVVELVPADHDALDDDARILLHASLERAWAQERAGQGRPAASFLDEL